MTRKLGNNSHTQNQLSAFTFKTPSTKESSIFNFKNVQTINNSLNNNLNNFKNGNSKKLVLNDDNNCTGSMELVVKSPRKMTRPMSQYEFPTNDKFPQSITNSANKTGRKTFFNVSNGTTEAKFDPIVQLGIADSFVVEKSMMATMTNKVTHSLPEAKRDNPEMNFTRQVKQNGSSRRLQKAQSGVIGKLFS